MQRNVSHKAQSGVKVNGVKPFSSNSRKSVEETDVIIVSYAIEFVIQRDSLENMEGIVVDGDHGFQKVATPPNAIIFASGLLHVKDMLLAGTLATIECGLLAILFMMTWAT
ncbi:hypothetical protein WUBG_10675 [Wuchereria bancrofti]|uniref:Uncharacterized protein n=1 Tax=Wuchereria bancrofti TaxID=6293 RepID=J9E8E6_WUCBA|nr:hypothetical protein WUBG_10675 [Wuchereria bancrofti]